jgi:hypothetical protein
MKYNKSQRSNLNQLALNRFNNDQPREMWFEEGQHFFTIKPKLSPYAINIYEAIDYAIEIGVIRGGCCPKGIYANDEEAILAGLVEGDIYEYSINNNFGVSFTGLLKVVRENIMILPPSVVGTGGVNVVIGTGVPNQIIGI